MPVITAELFLLEAHHLRRYVIKQLSLLHQHFRLNLSFPQFLHLTSHADFSVVDVSSLLTAAMFLTLMLLNVLDILLHVGDQVLVVIDHFILFLDLFIKLASGTSDVDDFRGCGCGIGRLFGGPGVGIELAIRAYYNSGEGAALDGVVMNLVRRVLLVGEARWAPLFHGHRFLAHGRYGGIFVASVGQEFGVD